jgi:hypothetical protein
VYPHGVETVTEEQRHVDEASTSVVLNDFLQVFAERRQNRIHTALLQERALASLSGLFTSEERGSKSLDRWLLGRVYSLR